MKILNLSLMLEKKTKGFTLIELVFGVGILAIIFLLISSFIFSSTKLSNTIIDSSSIDSEIYYTVDFIFNEIDKADYILEKSFTNLLKSNQLGLIIVTKTTNEYSITSYTFENSDIIRKNIKKKNIDNISSLILESNTFHPNVLISDIKGFSTNYDSINRVLSLEITDQRDKTFKYSHFIRGAIYE